MTWVDLGRVVGEDGAPGVGVAETYVDDESGSPTFGHLIVVLTDETVVDTGLVVGPEGPQGDPGEAGPVGPPVLTVWDGVSAYVENEAARIYVGGPTDPTSEPGDIWFEIIEEL